MVFLQFFFSLFIGDSLAISSLHSRWNLPSLSPILQIKNAERSTRRLSLFCRLSVEVTSTVLLSEKSPKFVNLWSVFRGMDSIRRSVLFKSRESGKFLLVVSGIHEIFTCGIWNPGLQEFGIPPRIGIWNQVPGIRNPQHGIQKPKLSSIPLHGAILLASLAGIFRGSSFFIPPHKRLLNRKQHSFPTVLFVW